MIKIDRGLYLTNNLLGNIVTLAILGFSSVGGLCRFSFGHVSGLDDRMSMILLDFFTCWWNIFQCFENAAICFVIYWEWMIEKACQADTYDYKNSKIKKPYVSKVKLRHITKTLKTNRKCKRWLQWYVFPISMLFQTNIGLKDCSSF